MSPKLTITQGENERVVEVSEADLRHLLNAVEEHSVNKLIDPVTRKPRPTLEPVNAKLTQVRKAIAEILNS